MNKRSFVIIFCMILFGGVASILFFLVNQKVGISYDSAIYFEVAENVKTGNGFYVMGHPVAHYPPFYPFLLSLFDFFNNNVVKTARFLHAFLFGINIVLIGLAVHVYTKKSIAAPVIAILLFISSPYLFIVQSFAWSESLFLALSLCGYILLVKYMTTPHFFTFLTGSLCLGLAAITRYAGISLILPALGAFLLLWQRPWKERVEKGFVFCLIACIPLGIWHLRNLNLGISERDFGFHIITPYDIKFLIYTMYKCFFPIFMNLKYCCKILAVLSIFALLIICIIIIYNRIKVTKNLNEPVSIFLPICTMFSIIYIFFIIIVKSFYDKSTPFDYRILSPVFVFILISIVLLFWYISNLFKTQIIWYAFIVIASFAVLLNSKQASLAIINVHKYGLGFNSDNFKAMMKLKNLDNSILAYSNANACIRYATGRQTAFLPNKDDKNQLNKMYNLCESGKAIIAYLNEFSWRNNSYNLPSQEDIEATGHFNVFNYNDGTILISNKYFIVK